VTRVSIRTTYLAAASAVVELLGHPAVAGAWERSSALERMSVGDLAGHLTRSIHQVRAFLEAPDPGAADPIAAEVYFGDLTGRADLDSPLDVGVRRRSRDAAAAGPEEVARGARAGYEHLAERLPGQACERQLLVFGERPMQIEEYLRTRLVEFAVHHDDLVVSLADQAGQAPSGLPVLPDEVRKAAVEVLVGVARHRHGDLAVLRALSRRERDPIEALRVF
jgi:hypothetical protein